MLSVMPEALDLPHGPIGEGDGAEHHAALGEHV